MLRSCLEKQKDVLLKALESIVKKVTDDKRNENESLLKEKDRFFKLTSSKNNVFSFKLVL